MPLRRHQLTSTNQTNFRKRKLQRIQIRVLLLVMLECRNFFDFVLKRNGNLKKNKLTFYFLNLSRLKYFEGELGRILHVDANSWSFREKWKVTTEFYIRWFKESPLPVFVFNQFLSNVCFDFAFEIGKYPLIRQVLPLRIFPRRFSNKQQDLHLEPVQHFDLELELEPELEQRKINCLYSLD